jgi:hypothetical protein
MPTDSAAKLLGRTSKMSRKSIPTANQFLRAFERVLPDANEAQLRMLRAHFKAPDYTLTASQLAKAAKYKNYSGANLHYGKLAGKLCDELHWRDRTRWNVEHLAEPAPRSSKGQVRLTLRPAVVSALRQYGWR